MNIGSHMFRVAIGVGIHAENKHSSIDNGVRGRRFGPGFQSATVRTKSTQ